jgi:hypothetical protein
MENYHQERQTNEPQSRFRSWASSPTTNSSNGKKVSRDFRFIRSNREVERRSLPAVQETRRISCRRADDVNGYTPPIVGSWNSKNSSRTKRTTRHDFPTAVSPRRTSLKWCTLLAMVVMLVWQQEEIPRFVPFGAGSRSPRLKRVLRVPKCARRLP